jgi:putative addiction module component (TIGR02574 family)
MTMIPLSPELETALAARAAEQGVGLEELVQSVLWEAAGDIGFASKEIEEAWIAEINRRVDDYDSGRTVAVDGDEAMKRIRENLRSRRAAA